MEIVEILGQIVITALGCSAAILAWKIGGLVAQFHSLRK